MTRLTAMSDREKLLHEIEVVKKERDFYKAKLREFMIVGTCNCSSCDTGLIGIWKKTDRCSNCEWKVKQK